MSTTKVSGLHRSTTCEAAVDGGSQTCCVIYGSGSRQTSLYLFAVDYTKITFGSAVKLMHKLSGFRLHSHQVRLRRSQTQASSEHAMLPCFFVPC